MTRRYIDKELARKIEAIMPPPKSATGRKRILVTLSIADYERVKSFGKERGEKIATSIRNLTLTALEALGK